MTNLKTSGSLKYTVQNSSKGNAYIEIHSGKNFNFLKDLEDAFESEKLEYRMAFLPGMLYGLNCKKLRKEGFEFFEDGSAKLNFDSDELAQEEMGKESFLESLKGLELQEESTYCMKLSDGKELRFYYRDATISFFDGSEETQDLEFSDLGEFKDYRRQIRKIVSA